jgi:hypothetical protein
MRIPHLFVPAANSGAVEQLRAELDVATEAIQVAVRPEPGSQERIVSLSCAAK